MTISNQTQEVVHYSIESMGNDVYHVYLFNEIDEPSYYADLCNFFRVLGDKAEVKIYINSVGGQIDTTVSILSAMEESAAIITTVAEGTVASAATLLFLSGDLKIIKPFTQFLFHPAKSGSFGKIADIKSSFNAAEKIVEQLYRNYYSGILTDEELTAVLEHKELYILSDEMAERLEKLEEYQSQDDTQLPLDLED